MIKSFILGISIISVAVAQPGTCYILGTNSGCSTGPQSPSLQSYVGTVTTQLSNLVFGNSVKPQIVVEMTAATPSYRTTDSPGCQNNGTCVFSTANSNSVSIGLINYFNYALKNSGANVVVYNFDPYFGLAASEYAGTCKATDPNFNSWQLSQDVLMLQAIQSAGFQIWLSATGLPSSMTACGYTLGSITAAQYNSAIDPMITAYIKHLNNNSINVTAVVGVHEVNGIQQITTENAVAFSPSDFTLTMNGACAATTAANNTIRCGAGFTASDGTWATYAFAHYNSSVNTFFAETYGPYNAYTQTIENVESMCASALAAGLQRCDNSEGNPPVWGTGNSESDAFAGCTWSSWTTYNQIYSWLFTVSHHLAANNFSSFVYFGTYPMAYQTSSMTPNCYASDNTDAPYLTMTNSTGSTSVLQLFQQATSWSAINVQGVTIQGIKVN